MNKYLRHAFTKHVIIRSTKIALVVGTIIALINHFDAIFTLTLDRQRVLKILITYLVPYSVATYSATREAFHKHKPNFDRKQQSSSRPGK